MGVSTDAIVFCGWLLPQYDEEQEIEDLPIWDAYDSPAGELPVDVIHHCHGEFPMWAIAIPGTIARASRGDPVELMPEHVLFDVDKVSAAIQYCVEKGIDIESPDSKPRWWVASYWDG